MGDLERLRKLYEENRERGPLDDALALYLTDPESDDVAWHVMGAIIAWRMGEHYQAKRAVEYGFRLGATGDSLGRLRFVGGSIYVNIGDFAQATELLTDLMAEWNEYPELRPDVEAPALHNLALAYRCQRRFPESLEASSRAEEIFGRQGKVDGMWQTAQNQAWVLCEMNDGARAGAVLDRIEWLCTKGDALQHQSICRAYATLVTGDHRTAGALARQVIADGEAPNDVRALAAWLRGRSHLAAGDTEEAVCWARVCQDWAVRSGETRLMSYAAILLRDAHTALQPNI